MGSARAHTDTKYSVIILISRRTSSPPFEQSAIADRSPSRFTTVTLYDIYIYIIKQNTTHSLGASRLLSCACIYNALPVYKQGLVRRARGVPQEDTAPSGCARAAAGTRWPAVSVCLYVCRTVRRRSATAASAATTCASSFRSSSRRRLVPLAAPPARRPCELSSSSPFHVIITVSPTV